MATILQIEELRKSTENYINKELKNVFGLQNMSKDDLLEEDISNIVNSLDDKRSFFSKNTIREKYKDHFSYSVNNEVFLDISIHKITYENVDSLFRDGLIPSLKRKHLIKDYKTLLKEAEEDEELCIYYAIVT